MANGRPHNPLLSREIEDMRGGVNQLFIEPLCDIDGLLRPKPLRVGVHELGAGNAAVMKGQQEPQLLSEERRGLEGGDCLASWTLGLRENKKNAVTPQY